MLSQDDLDVNDLRNLKYPKNEDSTTYHRKVTHNVTEFIRSITFRVRDAIPSTNKLKVTFDSESSDIIHHVTDRYSKTFGRCFLLEVPQSIQQFKVLLLLK